jgi:hypothetical protein
MFRTPVLAAFATVVGLVPQIATAQRSPLVATGSVIFEGLYDHVRFETQHGGRMKLNGVGGRLLFAPFASDGGDSTRMIGRLSVGPYFFGTREVGPSFRTWDAGLEADLHLLQTPAFGRVQPLVSVGLGAVHAGIDEYTLESDRIASSPYTAFAATPALGVRVGLYRNVAVRMDLRDAIAFRDGLKHHYGGGAGFSLLF